MPTAASRERADLDAAVRHADPARWLSSRLVADTACRADLMALYAFDHELERAGRVASTPLLAEIRFSWWREALDEIFAGGPVRGHPAARAVARAVDRRGWPRGPLEAMVEARVAVLGRSRLDGPAASGWGGGVGASAAILAALTIDPAARTDAAAPAGRAWGLSRLRRAGRIEDADAARLIEAALADARSAARDLSAAAFPAVAHVTLIGAASRSGAEGGLEARARLVWASLTGRL